VGHHRKLPRFDVHAARGDLGDGNDRTAEVRYKNRAITKLNHEC